MIREIINGLMRNNADTLDGKDSTEFLGKTEKAADSNLLDGQEAVYFKKNFFSASNTVPTTSWYRLLELSYGVLGRLGIHWYSDTGGTHYGDAYIILESQCGDINKVITSIGGSKIGSNNLTKLRLVYESVDNTHKEYLEIYNPSIEQVVNFTLDAYVVSPDNVILSVTGGSIPVGYTSKEITFVNGFITTGQITTEIATGIAPLVVSSTTKVDNLNADQLDGYHITDIALHTTATQTIWVYENAIGTGDGSTKTNGYTTLQAAIDSLPDVCNHTITIKVAKGSTNYLGQTAIVRGNDDYTGGIGIVGENYASGSCESNAVAGKIVDVDGTFTGLLPGDRVVCSKYSGTVENSSIEDYFYATVTETGAGYCQTSERTKIPTTGWTYVINQTVMDGNNSTSDIPTIRFESPVSGVSYISFQNMPSYGNNSCGSLSFYSKMGNVWECIFLNTCGISVYHNTLVTCGRNAFINSVNFPVVMYYGCNLTVWWCVFHTVSTAYDTLYITNTSQARIMSSGFFNTRKAVNIDSGCICTLYNCYIDASCLTGVYGYNTTLVSCTNNATTPETVFISGGKIADSDKLDGQHGSYYSPTTHNHDTSYLGIAAKASDSDKLDGYHITDIALHTTATQTIWVYEDAIGTGDGSTKANGYTTLQAAIDSLPDVCNHTITIKVAKGSTNYLGQTSVIQKASITSLTVQGEFYAQGSCESNAVAGKIIDVDGVFANLLVGDRVVCSKYSGTVENSSIEDYFYATVTKTGAGYCQTSEGTKVPTTGWTYVINQTVFNGNNDTTDILNCKNHTSITGITFENVNAAGIFSSSSITIYHSIIRDCFQDIYLSFCDKSSFIYNSALFVLRNPSYGIDIQWGTSVLGASLLFIGSAGTVRGTYSNSESTSLTLQNCGFFSLPYTVDAVWSSQSKVLLQNCYFDSTCTYSPGGYNITSSGCVNNAVNLGTVSITGGKIADSTLWDGQARPVLEASKFLQVKADGTGFQLTSVATGGGTGDLTGLVYKGILDASGGTYPTGVVQGDYYIISVAGTISGTSYEQHDWAIYNGSTWDKLDSLINTTLGIIYVESALISTQTTTPDNDTYYVLYPTAYGNDWYGHNNEIAHYNNSIWTFITPIVGQIVYAKDTSQFMYYSANLTNNGSTTRWQYLTSGILSRLFATLDWQGGFIQSVVGIENTPPSGFKYNTARYIVGNSPTGDWLNNSPGDIVQWDGESQSWITSGTNYGNSLIFNQSDCNYYAFSTSDFTWKQVTLFSSDSTPPTPVAYDTRIVYDILDSPPSGLPYTYIDIPFIVSDSPSTEFQGFEAQICMYDSTSHWMSLHSPVVGEIVFVQKKMAYYKFDGDYHTWRLYTSQFAISSVTKLDDYSGVSELDSSYHIILCDFSTATALSLPPPSSNNKVQFTLKNINVGVVTINPNSTETIDNATSKDINALESYTLLCDGANWWMI